MGLPRQRPRARSTSSRLNARPRRLTPSSPSLAAKAPDLPATLRKPVLAATGSGPGARRLPHSARSRAPRARSASHLQSSSTPEIALSWLISCHSPMPRNSTAIGQIAACPGATAPPRRADGFPAALPEFPATTTPADIRWCRWRSPRSRRKVALEREGADGISPRERHVEPPAARVRAAAASSTNSLW